MANRKSIRFSPAVTWLIPFMRSAKPLVDFRHIKSVSGRHLSTRMGVESAATITRSTTGRFSIVLTLDDFAIHRPRSQKRVRVTGIAENYTWEILSAFAHELAHTKQWQHTPAHMRLEARIMLRFARVCEMLGIKDTWSQRRPHGKRN